ncbi:hypothetical protein GCM10023084_25600 [Streptomyces lacrimifluminis]|uniref:Amidohydrolase n=1 Tax=Streptomyces lacrimifluminis TaxID=1500077 RepID=A0A917KJ71_9ACTN|nr:hypothetical protein [Streptomyces lacrimifluminis]GGJ13843.1 hypothetical protein GCM10012282_07650 [Streptomyces lacrimifluminis]
MSDSRRMVDAHDHLCDLDRRPKPWPDDPDHEPVRRTLGVAYLRSAAALPLAGREPERTVAVGCVAAMPETRELLTWPRPPR